MDKPMLKLVQEIAKKKRESDPRIDKVTPLTTGDISAYNALDFALTKICEAVRETRKIVCGGQMQCSGCMMDGKCAIQGVFPEPEELTEAMKENRGQGK